MTSSPTRTDTPPRTAGSITSCSTTSVPNARAMAARSRSACASSIGRATVTTAMERWRRATRARRAPRSHDRFHARAGCPRPGRRGGGSPDGPGRRAAGRAARPCARPAGHGRTATARAAGCRRRCGRSGRARPRPHRARRPPRSLASSASAPSSSTATSRSAGTRPAARPRAQHLERDLAELAAQQPVEQRATAPRPGCSDRPARGAPSCTGEQISTRDRYRSLCGGGRASTARRAAGRRSARRRRDLSPPPRLIPPTRRGARAPAPDSPGYRPPPSAPCR